MRGRPAASRRFFLRQKRHGPILKLHRREHRLQAVVIASWQRIELVIMAAAAAQRLAQERYPHALRDVIQELLPCFDRNAHGRMFPRAHPQKSRGDEHFGV